MKKIFIFCLLSLALSHFINAQETALTSKGKVVILYDDGTWKYADLVVTDEKTQTATIETKPETKPNQPLVLKDAEVEKKTFIEGPSKKLKKYFKDKNIVRCDFTLSSKDGKVRMHTDWKVMTGEGYSYFGFIKDENKISLELINGQTVDLIYTQRFEPKEFERYGFSTYSAFIDLNEEQLHLLKNQIVIKAYMNWSKRTEEYKVVSPSYFIKAIPQILK